jgi:hypothetical protein
MAFPTIAAFANANVRAAGFSSVYAKPTGELYQTLGAISNAELSFKALEKKDSAGKNKVYAWEFTAKATMLQASLIEQELIDTIQLGTNAFLFRLMDSAAIPTVAAVTEGWVLLSAAQVGCKAKLIIPSTPDDNVRIELEWNGTLAASAIAAAIKASIDDNEFEATGGSGTLKTIGTYTAALNGGLPRNAGIVPCGITSITIAETGGAVQTIGKVRDFSAIFEWQADMDNLKRFIAYFVSADISFNWMETDATNLVNLGLMPDTEVDLVITLQNGIVYTLTNLVGVGISFDAMGDADKSRAIKFTHTGKFTLAQFETAVA